MNGYLSNQELRFYFCFTIILYFIMIYNVQTISNSNLKAYKFMNDGWKIFNRKVDNYDVEWQVFKDLIRNYWYWFLIHIVSGEIFRLFKFKNISILHFIIGLSACLHMYNIQFFIILLSQSLISYIISSVFKKKRHVWAITCLWLFILNVLKFESYFSNLMDILNIDESKVHDFLVIFAWCLLKNTSFNLERVTRPNEENFNLLNCLGYVFYIPTFHFGPIISYTRYLHMLENLHTEETYTMNNHKERIKKFLLKLLRFAFWYVVTEIGLHFFYIHYIAMEVDLKTLNIFALFGLGFLHGQFFNNKYIIQYGLPIALGEFEHIPMPNKPKCICRIHKYSDMWKFFDHGLYEFLFKYIYTKITTRSSSASQKIFASFITFSFIYIWHGLFDYILIWSIANYICIVIEKFIYSYIESKRFEIKALSIIRTEENLHRLRAYIGAHVLIPAILSNFFFFGGTDFGIEFVRRTYTFGLWNYFKISGTIFLLYPIAEAIKRYEQMNNKNVKYIY
ncbi:hypothetical protein PVAND_009657 [Polypedilum vanderplanki]|uniref:Protein-cysteine N-palmitoyltransferase Rasp n=1 Tax=Polypedilum vanderplanki TaxID=319348 RepID=A0A9J6CDF1_POLVA|nr:hypothetical protein PVAND_009657 [Polypedilum vanderplanki]